MERKNIAIFFNNLRGLKVYKYLEKKKSYNLDVYLCKKNLNKDILSKLKRYKLIKKIDTKFINYIKKKKYFLNIAAGWPIKFPIELINSSFSGTINLHAGKLPEYKGGSPLNWQIIEGKKKIYISIIKMTKGIDTGPIYFEKTINLKMNESIKELHDKVNKMYPLMTQKVILNIANGIKPKKQSKINSRYLKQRSDTDGEIKWSNMDANMVFNLTRALSKPYPGAFYIHKKNKVRIFKCKKINYHKDLRPGQIIYLKKKKIIKCKKGAIEILKEQI